MDKPVTSALSLTKADKEGYLTKQGGTVKNWKNRWFILEGNILYYFNKKEDNKPIGAIPLANSVIREATRKAGKQYCFSVETKERTYLLVANDQKDMDEWMNALLESIRRHVGGKDHVAQASLPAGTFFVNVAGLMCAHCEDKVKSVLSTTKGIDSFRLDVEEDLIEIHGNPNQVTLFRTLEEAGYLPYLAEDNAEIL